MRPSTVKKRSRWRRVTAAVAILVLVVGAAAGGAWWVGTSAAGVGVVGVEFFRTEESEARYMAAYDAVLAKWPVAYQEISVPTRLGTTHVIVSGAADAPPLILLHAAMATATVWRPNVKALSEQFRVYAVDVIGQGGRSVASRMIESRRDYADWLNDLLDGLGIARASLVGNSYGGFIALNHAAMAPERVDRVVLISPGGVFVSVMPLLRSLIYEGLKGAVLGVFRADDGPRRGPLAFIAGDAGWNEDDDDWLALARQLMDGSKRVNMFAPPVFPDAELGAIQTPTLLLIAEHEILYDAQPTLESAMTRMPGLEGEIVRGAHHLAAMSRPDAVNTRILNFLRAEERSTGN